MDTALLPVVRSLTGDGLDVALAFAAAYLPPLLLTAGLSGGGITAVRSFQSIGELSQIAIIGHLVLVFVFLALSGGE